MGATNATSSATLEIASNASAAFFGSFFAFLFGLATYYWTKWFERQNKDYDSIVRLEGILNEHLNVFSRNQYLIKGSIGTFMKNGVTYNILRQYRLIEDFETAFLDLNLINNYFGYKDLLNSLNNDFEIANKACDVLRETYLCGSINAVVLKYNSDILIQQLTALSGMATEASNETKRLLCTVRIKIEKDHPGRLGMHRLFWHPYQPTAQEIMTEMKVLDQEITTSKVAWSKQIERALKIKNKST